MSMRILLGIVLVSTILMSGCGADATNTAVPPTPTEAAATATSEPDPTDTPAPPTATEAAATATSEPPPQTDCGPNPLDAKLDRLDGRDVTGGGWLGEADFLNGQNQRLRVTAFGRDRQAVEEYLSRLQVAFLVIQTDKPLPRCTPTPEKEVQPSPTPEPETPEPTPGTLGDDLVITFWAINLDSQPVKPPYILRYTLDPSRPQGLSHHYRKPGATSINETIIAGNGKMRYRLYSNGSQIGSSKYVDGYPGTGYASTASFIRSEIRPCALVTGQDAGTAADGRPINQYALHGDLVWIEQETEPTPGTRACWLP